LQIHNEQDVEDPELISTWSAYHGRNLNEVVPWIGGLFPIETDEDVTMSFIASGQTKTTYCGVKLGSVVLQL